MSWANCYICGRFVGYSDENAVSFTPYGKCGDLEPPDREFICGRCYVNMDEEKKQLLARDSWLQPTYITKGESQ